MFDGEIVGEVSAEEADERTLGLMMANAYQEDAAGVIQEKDLPGWVRLGLVPFIQLIGLHGCRSLIWMMGEDPVAATRLYIEKVLGTAKGLSQTLFYATTLTFTGLSVAMAFQAGMFNIGSEGQGMVGGIGIAVVALWILGPMLPDDLARSSFWFSNSAFAGAALFGMLWALIPALLQAYRGSHPYQHYVQLYQAPCCCSC